jgi:hypothetical protein
VDGSSSTVSFTQSLTSGTKIGTIIINGVETDLYAPAASSGGALTTQVKSYTSGEMSVHDIGSGNISFTATGPGTGWYPTCATVNRTATVVLGAGVSVDCITMTSVGNNTCSGKIFFAGNSGNASTNRGTCTYYVTWAKIG